MSWEKRLTQAFDGAVQLPLSERSKFVLFSDCHRGSGDSNDNFLKNRNLYLAALQDYYRRGFSYLELGDGDELWENRCMAQIVEIHSDVFRLLSRFYQEKRLFLVYGNHDMVKKYPKWRSEFCGFFFDPVLQKYQPLFPELAVYQGVILTDGQTGKRLYLTHGHQADALNSVFWRVSRFLVRYVWRPLEHFGVTDPTRAAKNNRVLKKTEERLAKWAAEKEGILIAGHTHRPRLGTRELPYFNTGSCVHPRGITCIEIVKREMALIEWRVETDEAMRLKVAKQVLAGPVPLDELF
ncbi:MAG: metallophosphoesterase family protein [Eubacteriales bacterium]|nr:metallophosphoesterase family protein [Eubacteriales bacterium]